MTKIKIKITCYSLLFSSLATTSANEIQDYNIYHQQVIEAEKFIASGKYDSALLVFERLFNDYDFVFLSEYQIASQLSLYLNDNQKAINYLKQGISSGWKLKSIKKNAYLKPLLKGEEWKSVKKE